MTRAALTKVDELRREFVVSSYSDSPDLCVKFASYLSDLLTL